MNVNAFWLLFGVAVTIFGIWRLTDGQDNFDSWFFLAGGIFIILTQMKQSKPPQKEDDVDGENEVIN